MKRYDKAYFIQKFQAIPEQEIGSRLLENHCALWHCGVRIDESGGNYMKTEEAVALADLLRPFAVGIGCSPGAGSLAPVWFVNDRGDGPTPSARILNALAKLPD